MNYYLIPVDLNIDKTFILTPSAALIQLVDSADWRSVSQDEGLVYFYINNDKLTELGLATPLVMS